MSTLDELRRLNIKKKEQDQQLPSSEPPIAPPQTDDRTTDHTAERTTGLLDYKTTGIPVVQTTGLPVVENTRSPDYQTTSSPISSPIGGQTEPRKRKKPIRVPRIAMPVQPVSPKTAIAQMRDAAQSEPGVINFKGPAELNNLLDEYLARNWKEGLRKQDLIARALMLLGYEMATGEQLVDFDEGDGSPSSSGSSSGNPGR